MDQISAPATREETIDKEEGGVLDPRVVTIPSNLSCCDEIESPMQDDAGDEDDVEFDDETALINKIRRTGGENIDPKSIAGGAMQPPMSSSSSSSSSSSFDDLYAKTVRGGTGGITLYAIIVTASCMALVSLILLLEYRYPPATATLKLVPPLGTLNHNDSDGLGIENDEEFRTNSGDEQDHAGVGVQPGHLMSPPQLWAHILSHQIPVIQNLVHASLFGGAGIVAAFRGDVLWFLLVHNASFFFGLVALAYLVVDVWVMNEARTRADGADGNEHEGGWSIRPFLAFPFATCCIMVYIKTSSTLLSLRKLNKRARQDLPLGTSLQKSDGQHYPRAIARTRYQYQMSRFLHWISCMIQLIAFIYTVFTVAAHVLSLNANNGHTSCTAMGISEIENVDAPNPCSTKNVVDQNHSLAICQAEATEAAMTKTDMELFEMAYSLGAHQAFLLSLIHLASIFPGCHGSIGGAILVSSWRLIVSICYLYRIIITIVRFGSDAATDGGGSMAAPRLYSSLAFVVLESTTMAPVLVIAILLRWECTRKQKEKHPGPVKQPMKGEEENDTEKVCEPQPFKLQECYDKKAETFQFSQGRIPRPTLVTLDHISTSPNNYSKAQRLGARALWMGSFALLLSMTVECMLLLSLTSPLSHLTNDILKWGMHVCAMYLFCTVMTVSSPDVYQRGRVLLLVASPSGSAIGLLQLYHLSSVWFSLSDHTDTSTTLFCGCLILWRVVCGLVQTQGLLWLKNTVPSETMETGSWEDCSTQRISHLNFSNFSRGQKALYRVFYLPSLTAFVISVALFGSCTEPLISPTAPSLASGCLPPTCRDSALDESSPPFVMAQNWTGIGLFFHFGVLFVIFAADGMSSVPSYLPSLKISKLFVLHVAILVAFSLLSDSLITSDSVDFSWLGSIRKLLLLVWGISAFWLCWNLNATTTCCRQLP